MYWVKNLIFNFLRSIHLRYADYLSVSPYAKSRFIKNFLYGKSFEKKIHIWPTPVAPHFKIVPGIERQRKVVCVGRWTDNAADAIKRPGYCMGVAAALVSKDTEVIVEIYGRIGEGMLKMHESIPSDQRNRILLKGYAHNSDLPRIYSGAQVTICTSYSEGTHIASAEAVCCGCSVVVPPTERHRVIQWYTSHDSGRIPDEDTPESMANAVLDELQCWQNQNRNPEEISSYWQEVFHTDKAMKRIFNL